MFLEYFFGAKVKDKSGIQILTNKKKAEFLTTQEYYLVYLVLKTKTFGEVKAKLGI